jgi:hypothetical protein
MIGLTPPSRTMTLPKNDCKLFISSDLRANPSQAEVQEQVNNGERIGSQFVGC